jgi:hypothetical protein
MRKSALATVFLASLAFTGAANASLIGVKSVTITNSLNQYLQVSEFQAFQSGTGTNVALASSGAIATTTSGTWDGNSTPGKAIDGAYSNLSFPNMYHNAQGTTGNLTITFAAVDNLDSFTIYGRSDCCSDRDVYNVAFFGANGNLLYTASSVDATNGLHMASRALPEPGSIALFGLGLAGLAGVARRRKQRA